MKRVILTAIGCPGGPSIIQMLRDDADIYIIGTDIRNDMLSKYLVDEFYQVPAGKSEDFIPKMKELVVKTNAEVILPLATFELLTLSKHISEFENLGCKVCVSNYESLNIANNKSLLYEYFKTKNYTPEYRILENSKNLKNLANEIGFPANKVVVKPFISHGSIGLRIIDNDVDLFEQYRHHKPNNLIIPMDLACLIFNKKSFDDIMLSEYLPGKEYGVDILIHPITREIIKIIARDNGDVFHSEISNGKIIEYVEIINIAKDIVSCLNLSYTINIDFKLDKNNKPKVLEINPRLPATAFLPYSAGFNFPLYSVYLALGIDIPVKSISKDRKIFSYRGFAVINSENKIIDKAL